MKFLRTDPIARSLTIGLLACWIPTLGHADAAQDFKTKLDQMQDLKGRFAQVLRDKTGAELQASVGEFALKRPGYFLWQSEAPYEQTVIGTPEKVWVYDPDLEQVTVSAANTQKANNPARLLSGDLSEIRSSFEVTAKSDAQGVSYHLVPKADDSPYRFMEFEFNKNTLASLNFRDKLDQDTSIRFEGVQENSKLPADIFVFTPPAGTDVIVDE